MLPQANQAPARCEACVDGVNPKHHKIGLWLCDACYVLEDNAIEEKHASEEMQQTRINAAKQRLMDARVINTSAQISQDIFNQETVSIEEIRQAIWANPDIQNKQFAYAEEVQRLLNHTSKLIFDTNKTLVELVSKQRKQQEILAEISNSLRAEEREKLRLQHIDYKVTPVKPVSKPKLPPKPKFSIDELRAASKVLQTRFPELGNVIWSSKLQGVVTQSGCTLDEAVEKISKLFGD